MDKRDRASVLRDRLAEAMALAGTNQSSLARAIRVDRSTVSQILAGSGARLPNAHLVASCAQALGVSSDWLLGLSEKPERAEDLVANALSMTEASRALVDKQILDWHSDAEGYKIRHVPATLPDMFKTRAVLEWEYGPHLGRTARQAIDDSSRRLDWMLQSRSDYEIAVPLYELHSFAEGTGYYEGLCPEIRAAQLDQISALSAQLYPRMRFYLFDARRLYSAPITIFGPKLAVLYLGRNYIVFRDAQRIDAITRHFDQLLREASVSSRDMPQYIAKLRQQD